MFLEILTRTFGERPKMLKRCQESLELLTDPDWEQRVIVDDQTRGVAWANRNLSTIEARGDWVWVLDDDDLCTYPNLIGEMKELVARVQPDVVMVRVYHAKFGLLPPDETYGRQPVMGQISSPNVFVRRDVWNNHRDGWQEEYAGDFWFINRLWEADLAIAWLPRTVAYQPQQNVGAAETERPLPAGD